MDDLPILILAAGASLRMGGRDKLMLPVRGQTLLADRAGMALRCSKVVIVALPARDQAADRWATLDGLPVRRLSVPDRSSGLSASLRAGIAALPETARGVMVLLADMPELTAADLQMVRDGWDGETATRGATDDGRPGHPVIFPRRLFGALADLRGDRGAGALLASGQEPVRLVPLPGTHALCDLDTPADIAAWRARR